MAIQALEEVEQYRALGTVEELKEAREKQIPKKVERWGDRQPCCPICKCGVVKPDRYCVYCGQKIDWSEEE